MPVDINRLTEGWLELESDPGLFTLLLEDFGVKGVQVEEIYDLQKSLEGPVYGFIFLFRWIEERRSRRKVVDQSETFVKDEEVVNNIFFAQQMVPNSCATHALLSVLLNCPNIHLGSTLSRLKAHTSGMCPENKGWAIGNTPELAKAHNSHAMPQAKRRLDKSSTVSTGRYTGEAFHFVSYVPIHGKLFELDGLKPYPMDHGPWGEKEDWTEKFRRVITDRLGIATGEQYHDIRFNLMAVVPDRRLALVHKLKMLKTNRQIVLEALQQLVKLTHPDLTEKENAQNADDKKEAEAHNIKKEATKSNSEKVKINGVIIDTESSKTAKKENFEQDLCNPSHPVLATHNYAKDPSANNNITSTEKSAVDSRQEGREGKQLTPKSSENHSTAKPITLVDSHESASSQSNCQFAENTLFPGTQTSVQKSTTFPSKGSPEISQSSQSSHVLPTGAKQLAVTARSSPVTKVTSDVSSHSIPSSQVSATSTTTIAVPVITTTHAARPASTAQQISSSSTSTIGANPSAVTPVITHTLCSPQPPSSLQLHTAPTATISTSSASSNSATHATSSSASLLCPPGPPDYSTPLTIQTSPAPSTSSTDTSSEVGSAFNSPTQGWGWNSGQSSPTSTKDFKKFVVIRVAGSGEEKVDSPSARVVANVNSNGKRQSSDAGNATKRVCVENGQKVWEKETDKTSSSPRDAQTTLVPKGNSSENDCSPVTEEKKPDAKICSKYPELFEPHTFAPKDLLALLKNLENEISVCEMNLRDENEKRKKYKIDDCRRTHNYDDFICTFLSMLAQQGKLADLVQQHLLLKKPGLPVARVQRATKKTETRPSPSRRRRGRTKYRKRK